jgi:CcmD family protein
MIVFEPSSALSGLLAAIQDSPAVTGFAAEAAARPEAVARGFRFLTAAYCVVWAVLAAYLMMLSFRLRRVAAQIRRIRERLGV